MLSWRLVVYVALFFIIVIGVPMVGGMVVVVIGASVGSYVSVARAVLLCVLSV